MMWKKILRKFELSKEWDAAIEFMEKTIADDPSNMDAYIFMNYLLINLLAKEDYDDDKYENYTRLTRKYFKESYSKFSDNPEFLYLTGKTARMAPWYWGFVQSDFWDLFAKVETLEPDNLVYRENYYCWSYIDNKKMSEAIAYAQTVLGEYSPVAAQLKTKGALGEYLWNLKKRAAEEILWNFRK